MKREKIFWAGLLLVSLTVALASSLTLLAVVGAGFYMGRLAITGAIDPLSLALDTDGSQLAVIYPVGSAEEVEAMQRAVLADKDRRR